MTDDEINAEKSEFDKLEYDESYFSSPEKREEIRKYLLSETSEKIDQHIKYFLGLIATAITLILSRINSLIIFYGGVSVFILLIYVFTGLLYWSTFYDYTLTSAPKKHKKLNFFNQDNLVARYYWANQYRFKHHDSFRRRIAYYLKQIFHFTNVIIIWFLFTIVFLLWRSQDVLLFIQSLIDT